MDPRAGVTPSIRNFAHAIDASGRRWRGFHCSMPRVRTSPKQPGRSMKRKRLRSLSQPATISRASEWPLARFRSR